MDFDYKKLGLKCGLEVHQQLDTEKLFCRCPSKLREEKPDIVFTRKMNLAASELGEYDPAALEAYKRGTEYVYQGYSDSNCLIETDEEPPMNPNPESLKVILEIALLCNSNPVDESIAMRKTVLDGSVTSGFQRTMLIASGGIIDIGSKKIGIQTIILEEDACRKVGDKENQIIYCLDRLGIPLIELATEPEIFTPEEAKLTALKIGEAMRLTGKVKRGLGTIRQDVNISIAQGARVEIKGVQELGLIDEYVRREVQRQVKLLEIRDELKKRNVDEKLIVNSKSANLTKLFFGAANEAGAASTQCKVIADGLKRNFIVLGIKLPNFKGLLGREVQPGRRLGTEVASYVKARAGAKGIFHSDELPNYGISEKEISDIRKSLECREQDAFAIVCERPEKSGEAILAIKDRAVASLKGVPEETRNALEDGNSVYMRPLPGAARMYPETDVRSVRLTKEMLSEIKKNLPLSVAEKLKLYTEKFKLPKQLAEKMVLDNNARFFEELCSKGFSPTRCAVVLLEEFVKLGREGFKVDEIPNEIIEKVLKAESERKLTKELSEEAFKQLAKNPGTEFEKLLENLGKGKATSGEIEKIIMAIVERNRKAVEEKGQAAFSALMGDAMRELKGKATGQEISRLLNEEIRKIKK